MRARSEPARSFRRVAAFVLAASVTSGLTAPSAGASTQTAPCDSASTPAAANAAANTQSSTTLPRRDLLDLALSAYKRADEAGLLRNKLLTVIDYSLPSFERRLWVVEPAKMQVLFHELVAHGRGSSSEEDPERAVRFGNKPSSLQSSLGTFLTADTYNGKHGNSLNLLGLDPGINDKALERRIVMHPAGYMSEEFRTANGRIGRSWGCPALDPVVAPKIIETIREGSVIYVAGLTAAAVQPLASAANSSR